MTQAAVLSALGSAGTTTGFKNRIINGAMQIAQRSVGPVTNQAANSTLIYDCMDRWGYWALGSGLFSTQQSSVAPVGFSNSVLITSLSAASVGSTFYVTYSQRIESFNYYDLMWGTSNAKAVTVSFWVRNSLTGTFSGYIFNNGYQYCYPFNYTISAANTWTYITVTIPGPTSGTWATTGNGIGLEIGFTLGAGSSYTFTPNTWGANNFAIAGTGSTNFLATNGATMYITGVQLEVGNTATNFDVRSYGTELALCQRYYFVKAQGASAQEVVIINGGAYNSGQIEGVVTFPVSMRASPSQVSPTVSSGYQYSNGGGTGNFNSFAGAYAATPLQTLLYFSVGGATSYAYYRISIVNGSTTAYLAYSAEL